MEVDLQGQDLQRLDLASFRNAVKINAANNPHLNSIEFDIPADDLTE